MLETRARMFQVVLCPERLPHRHHFCIDLPDNRKRQTMSRFTVFKSFLAFASVLAAPVTAAPVKPGDLIAPDNASVVSDFVSPREFRAREAGLGNEHRAH
jgi:hypothetical protein